ERAVQVPLRRSGHRDGDRVLQHREPSGGWHQDRQDARLHRCRRLRAAPDPGDRCRSGGVARRQQAGGAERRDRALRDQANGEVMRRTSVLIALPAALLALSAGSAVADCGKIDADIKAAIQAKAADRYMDLSIALANDPTCDGSYRDRVGRMMARSYLTTL